MPKLYSKQKKFFKQKGPYKFGPLSTFSQFNDPQYILFQISRYKHASKILHGKKTCIEIGVGDGVGVPILCQHFKKVLATDIDNRFFKYFYSKKSFKNLFFEKVDFVKKFTQVEYDSAVCFDVISSIKKKYEKKFFENIKKSLKKNSIFVLGTQNKLTTKYSHKSNLYDQPNFKTYDQLKTTMEKYFENVIILSMNDETIHTGKRENSQYFLAIGICPK